MSRLSSGLLLADPDAPDSPLGRTTRGILFGLLATVMISAGATVYGLLRPGGNDSWRSGENLVINHDTGARYLYADGTLHPVLNYASARLIGGAEMAAVNVGSASLRGTPVGEPVGIPGAPDTVPGSDELDNGAWHLCVTGPEGALPSTSGATESAVVEPGATTVVAGAPVKTDAVAGDHGVLVRGPDKKEYLVWHGSRLLLDAESDARDALGYGSVSPVPVSAAFLNALAPGPSLTPPEVPGRGDDGPELGGEPSRVGQVFEVTVPGGSSSYYVLRADGLAPLTPTGAALLLGAPATQKDAYGGKPTRVRMVGTDVLSQHRSKVRTALPDAAGLPTTPPKPQPVPRGTAVCAKVQGGSEGARITTVLAPLEALAPVTVSAGIPGPLKAPCVKPDAGVVRPGHGALVRALNASGAAHAGTTYLVSENGVKYRVPSTDSLHALGYDTGDIASVPAPLLATLPTGADLDRAAATGAAPPRTTAAACGDTAATGAGSGSGKPGGDENANDHNDQNSRTGQKS